MVALQQQRKDNGMRPIIIHCTLAISQWQTKTQSAQEQTFSGFHCLTACCLCYVDVLWKESWPKFAIFAFLISSDITNLDFLPVTWGKSTHSNASLNGILCISWNIFGFSKISTIWIVQIFGFSLFQIFELFTFKFSECSYFHYLELSKF